MTVTNTGISWTRSTWNLWVGCKSVSGGCANCYARTLVDVRWPGTFGHPFDQVRLHMHRLADVRRFTPVPGPDGGLVPHLVFVNSMSDFFFEQVPDSAIHQALDAMEENPAGAIFQVLSKRPIRARKLIVDRYRGRGVPPHIWFGFTAEDNQVKGRLDILRTIRDRTGGGVFFASIEPIIGPTDQLDLTGIDWAITGGESGSGARIMQRPWLLDALAVAERAGAAIWHKQSGQAASHPNLHEAPATIRKPGARFRWLVANGRELLPHEKGGATVDGRTYRELPLAFHTQAARLSRPCVPALSRVAADLFGR